MESIDNLYDHYKDTFNLQKGYLKKRDNLSVVILAFAIVLFLQIQSPEKVDEVAKAIIKKNADGVTIDFEYINFILLFAFLWIIMQYYGVVLLIERNYRYIHKIEEKLSEKGDYKINREGINYLEAYPWLKSVTNIMYKLGFPILIIGVAILKFIIELRLKYEFIIIDTFMLFWIIFISLLYISNRFFNEEYFDRKKHPNIDCCIRIIMYFKNK